MSETARAIREAQEKARQLGGSLSLADVAKGGKTPENGEPYDENVHKVVHNASDGKASSAGAIVHNDVHEEVRDDVRVDAHLRENNNARNLDRNSARTQERTVSRKRARANDLPIKRNADQRVYLSTRVLPEIRERLDRAIFRAGGHGLQYQVIEYCLEQGLEKFERELDRRTREEEAGD